MVCRYYRDMKTALITGISGQDGRLLTNFLLKKQYEVVGMISSLKKDFNYLEFPELSQVKFEVVDYNDLIQITKTIEKHKPDEIYNLTSLSSVAESFQKPIQTFELNSHFTIRLFEALSKYPNIKFYQASSSEMFGNQSIQPMNELSEFRPTSPYAISKVTAHHAADFYRTAYGLQISCGILFNHESYLRSSKFVSKKIINGVANIVLGKSEKISLGSLTAIRDWGAAEDYVQAMWLMLQVDQPDDFVIATGRPRSVLDFVSTAFEAAGLKVDPLSKITIDEGSFRKVDIDAIWGDARKAKEILGWEPRIEFKEMVRKMLDYELYLASQ